MNSERNFCVNPWINHWKYYVEVFEKKKNITGKNKFMKKNPERTTKGTVSRLPGGIHLGISTAILAGIR